jgi:DNA-directed RNA polymerase specialized sigma24 family protein
MVEHGGDNRGPVDGYVAGLIRLKARRMAVQLELCRADEEDIVQDLHLEVVMQSRAYDSGRGEWRPFLRVVVEHRCHKLAKRYFRSHRHQLVDGTEMGSGISRADLHRRVHRGATAPDDNPDVRIDVRGILRRLSDEDREFCRDLSSESISETARRRGLPRSTVQYHIERLKKSFQSLNPTKNPRLTPKDGGY